MIAAMMAAAVLEQAPAAAGRPALAVNVLSAPMETPRIAQRPTALEYMSAYPRAAASLGMGGKAVLDCHVAESGRLEGCKVAHEAPLGAGFGAAALTLSRSYRVEQGPVATSEVELPIGFATTLDDNALPVAGPWVAAPSFADVAGVYPDIGGGVAGQVVLHCALQRDGTLHACRTLYLKPTDRDFDVAAMKLAPRFRMQIDPAMLRNHASMVTDVVMSLAAPFRDEAQTKRIDAPAWLAAPSAADLASLYPAPAARNGVLAGQGAADCTVGADGALQDCRPFGAGEPPGLGFSEAAAKAAMMMRMSPWTDAGGPVDGALVRVPIRFTQAPAKYAGAVAP